MRWHGRIDMALVRIPLLLAALINGASPGVSLRIYDIVGVPPEAITAMQATTSAALAPAGITIRWAVCGDDEPRPTGCNAPRNGDVVVRLIDTHSSRAPGCGFAMAAPGGGGFISLTRTCVARTVSSLMKRSKLASRRPAMSGEVLGYFLAHELAHVLLPGAPHAHAGLFRTRLGRAEWKSLERGSLAFLPDDVDRLRAAIQASAPPSQR
jgi:hypothetical protein